MSDTFKYSLGLLAIILLLVAFMAYIQDQKRQCTEAGGAYLIHGQVCLSGKVVIPLPVNL